jgi:hypothetical protein
VGIRFQRGDLCVFAHSESPHSRMFAPHGERCRWKRTFGFATAQVHVCESTIGARRVRCVCSVHSLGIRRMSGCGAVRYRLHAYREDFLESFLQFKRDLLEGENVGIKMILDFSKKMAYPFYVSFVVAFRLMIACK